jgi:hypothetical protein
VPNHLGLLTIRVVISLAHHRSAHPQNRATRKAIVPVSRRERSSSVCVGTRLCMRAGSLPSFALAPEPGAPAPPVRALAGLRDPRGPAPSVFCSLSSSSQDSSHGPVNKLKSFNSSVVQIEGWAPFIAWSHVVPLRGAPTIKTAGRKRDILTRAQMGF